MTYNDVFYNSRMLLANIPLESKDFSFASQLVTDVILLQVEYDNKVKGFHDHIEAAMKKMVKAGFAERSKKIEQMRSVDERIKAYEDWCKNNSEGDVEGKECPTKPSPEEIAAAEEARAIKEEFDKEVEEYDKFRKELTEKKLQEEVQGFVGKLSKEAYSELVSGLGVQGDIDFFDVTGEKRRIPKMIFLRWIAERLVS